MCNVAMLWLWRQCHWQCLESSNLRRAKSSGMPQAGYSVQCRINFNFSISLDNGDRNQQPT
jgi:hypothetical protein